MPGGEEGGPTTMLDGEQKLELIGGFVKLLPLFMPPETANTKGTVNG